ncbi:MAG: hypothetical protein ABSD56_15015 [Bryobacteraceae bacterium]
MSPLSFLYPVLDALSDGRIIRKSMVLALRILGVLAAAGGVYTLVKLLKEIFDRTVPTEVTLGGLVLAILLLAGTACVVQICFYRARSVSRLGESAFTVVPIVSILFRWIGEVYATILATLAVGGCLFLWFAGSGPGMLLGPLRDFAPVSPFNVNSIFLYGLIFLVYVLMAAFVMLVLAYFLAESTLVMVDIALNIRRLVGGPAPAVAGGPAVPIQPSPAPASAMPVQPPPPPPPPAVTVCRVCGATVAPGSAFCGTCGNRA